MTDQEPLRQAIANTRKFIQQSILQAQDTKLQVIQHVQAPALQASTLYRSCRRSHTLELISGGMLASALLGLPQGRFGVMRNLALGGILFVTVVSPELWVRVGVDPFKVSSDCDQ
jgi:uncharacterized membrane protein